MLVRDEHGARRPRPWRLRPIWFAYLGLVGLLGTLHPALEPLRILALCGVIYLVLVVAGWLRAARQAVAESSQAARPDLPLPGPAERRGLGWFLGRFGISSLLTLLNPLQLAQMLLQLGGQVVIWLRWRGRPDRAAAHQSRVVYTLPVQGEWLVYNGGDTPETSHSWDILTQRYAYDVVVADAAGRRSAPGAGDTITDYFAYGRPVVAPADGVVVRVRDGVRDAPAPGSGWIDWRCRDFRGNFVVIRHAPGEYSFLAHLVPDQIAVRVGQQVARGELIGRCGNSGHSTEPHLHFHLQDHPNVFLAMGLPLRFHAVAVDGGPPGEHVLAGRMRVAQSPGHAGAPTTSNQGGLTGDAHDH